MVLHLDIQPITLFEYLLSSGWKRPSTQWAQLLKTTIPKSMDAYEAKIECREASQAPQEIRDKLHISVFQPSVIVH